MFSILLLWQQLMCILLIETVCNEIDQRKIHSSKIKHGDLTHLTCSGSNAMTAPLSAESVAPKIETKHPRLHYSIEVITAVLRRWQLRWPGRVQHAISCINSDTGLVIPGTKRRWWPRETWFECVKNNTRWYGLSGIDQQDIKWDTDSTLIGLRQRETPLHCNIFSHWMSPYPEWPLHRVKTGHMSKQASFEIQSRLSAKSYGIHYIQSTWHSFI